jgi:hypothetical protein
MTDDHSTSTEQAEKKQRADLMARARHQLTAVTEEFQHGLSKIRDPGTRRELTASYVDLLQIYLGKAQTRLTRYRGRLQLQHDAELAAPFPEPEEPAIAPEIGERADR